MKSGWEEGLQLKAPCHNTCRVKRINRFFEDNLFWDTPMPMLEIQKYSGNDLCHLLQSFCPGTADSWQQQSPSCDFIAYQIICRTTQKERCQNPVIKQTDIWRWKDIVEPFPSQAEVDQNALSRSLEPVWINVNCKRYFPILTMVVPIFYNYKTNHLNIARY